MLSSRVSRPVATAIVLAILGMPALVHRSYASVEPNPGPAARLERGAARQEPSHFEEPVPGVTVTLLASETTDDLPEHWGILFDRVPLESGASMADALTPDADDPWAHMLPSLGPFSGPQLLYIEAGEVVVMGDEGESVYSQGQQLVMPADAAYEVRNDTGRCASLLRLVAVPLFGGGFGANVSEPELAAQDCGRPTNYIGWSLPLSDVALPAQLFIAEVKWDPANYEAALDAGLGPHTHPGPIGLVIDAGTLMMSGDLTHILSPGSVVLIPEGVAHSEYYPAPAEAEPAVALMAGVVPAGMALVGEAGDGAAPGGNQEADAAEIDVPENAYTSPNHGYALTWNAPWVATDIQSEDGYDLLVLENGLSSVHLEGYEGYGGDPDACLDFQVDLLSEESGVQGIEIATTDGGPMRDEGDGWASAVYNFVLIDEAGNAIEARAYFKCQTLAPGMSVLVISQFTSQARYDYQVDARGTLLDGLTLPDSSS